ncbi:unnamed protein product, partial [Ectocarpus sp. 12 AP-2014]
RRTVLCRAAFPAPSKPSLSQMRWRCRCTGITTRWTSSGRSPEGFNGLSPPRRFTRLRSCRCIPPAAEDVIMAAPVPEVVGGLILKGRAHHWNVPNVHYHHGMGAGDNTLNAHCTRVLMRSLAASSGGYDREAFLSAYIGFMTADPPAHGDTYAESYHRGFFANLQRGLPPEQRAMITHDMPSVGGLVTVAALVFAHRLAGTALS